MTRIVIVGGYGQFGRLAAERLAREAELSIILAGRRGDEAAAAASALAPTARAEINFAVIDAARPDAERLAALSPSVVVNASGPFQSQDRALARASIAVGAHYVDLADAPGFVSAFAADDVLAAQAREKGLLAVTGASSVPAISSAAIDRFASEFAIVEEISIGISPGNSFDPGLATTRSILSSLGRPFSVRCGGRSVMRYGWQRPRPHEFPGIGRRWMCDYHVPDCDLFPARYPSAHTIEFQAGLEVPLMHFGMWALSWPARFGAGRLVDALASPLPWVKRGLRRFGTDRGGMYVEIAGRKSSGEQLRLTWHLLAYDGHGPYIPATPSVILARRLAKGDVPATGATAAIGLLALDDVLAEWSDLAIEAVVRRA